MKPNTTKIIFLFLALAWCIAPSWGQQTPDKKDEFKQLHEELPTPTLLLAALANATTSNRPTM